MAAKIKVVSPDLSIWDPGLVERLWFFPNGSDYLGYAPHFHVVHQGGFRQNLPLSHTFVVVMEGKLSVKDYFGKTVQRIHVAPDQIWRRRETQRPMPELYIRTVLHKVERGRRAVKAGNTARSVQGRVSAM